MKFSILASKHDEERRSLIKVWNLDNRKLLYGSIYENCNTMITEVYSCHTILVIFHKTVEILMFKQNNEISRFQLGTESLKKKLGFLRFPFVLIKEANTDNTTSMYVWKINLGQVGNFQLISQCQNLDVFTKDSEGNILPEEIQTCFFLENFFLSTCEKLVKVETSKDSWFSNDLFLRILDKRGYVTKEMVWPSYILDHEVSINVLIIHNKMFLKIDSDTYIYKKDADEFWKEDDTNRLDFHLITDLKAENVFFDRFSLGSVELIETNMFSELHIKKLIYF